jgi:hypothetical protein
MAFEWPSDASVEALNQGPGTPSRIRVTADTAHGLRRLPLLRQASHERPVTCFAGEPVLPVGPAGSGSSSG